MLHLATCCRRPDSNMYRMEINELGSEHEFHLWMLPTWGFHAGFQDCITHVRLPWGETDTQASQDTSTSEVSSSFEQISGRSQGPRMHRTWRKQQPERHWLESKLHANCRDVPNSLLPHWFHLSSRRVSTWIYSNLWPTSGTILWYFKGLQQPKKKDIPTKCFQDVIDSTFPEISKFHPFWHPFGNHYTFKELVCPPAPALLFAISPPLPQSMLESEYRPTQPQETLPLLDFKLIPAVIGLI